jgi:Mrp family chromosome partitioning ATPase
VTDLLDKRLVFVTGKGGVGKTAVASAVGLVAARRGKRTIVAEVARRDDVQRSMGEHLGDGLDALSVDPEEAMAMYLEDQLSRPLADVLKSSRIFGYLAAATPGMRELLTIGKLWELAQPERRVEDAEPYDLVVVDAPATGHGLALLDAPRTFAGVAAAGPVARQARIIHGTLTDRELTGIVAVATPEEMAVNEVDFLRGELGERLDLVVANGVRADRFSDAEAERIARAGEGGAGGEAGPAEGVAAAAARASLVAHHRARSHREQVERLGADVELPFAPEGPGGGADVETLAAALEGALGAG